MTQEQQSNETQTQRSETKGAGNLTIMSRAAVILLVVQYLLGMYLNLFVSLPTNLASIGGASLILHASIAFILLGLSIAMIWTARRISDSFGTYASLFSAIGVVVAILGGLGFTFGGQNNALSYVMSVGFLVAFATNGSLSGREFYRRAVIRS